MTEGQSINELRAWRISRDLTMDQAGALITIDGKATSRGTWCAWEHGKKRPSAAKMIKIEEVTGISPAVFYPRPANATATPLAACA